MNKNIHYFVILLKINENLSPMILLQSLQKTPNLLGSECQGVGTTSLHANERGQTESLYPQ